jgi:hypothetical protein
LGSYTNRSIADVAASGRYLYVADIAGLQIIDVSDPANPQRVGGYKTNYVEKVALSGQYAYVSGGSGLQVIDISDPANPKRVSGLNFEKVVFGIKVSGGYVYVATYGSLQVIDVSDPLHPLGAGRCDTPDDIYIAGMTVSGLYVYLANALNGLQVIDISNPANLQRVGGYNTAYFYAEGVTVSNHYAYVPYNEGLMILSLFQPSKPVVRLDPANTVHDGTFHFRVRGPERLTGRVERSSQFGDWLSWKSITLEADAVELVDSESAPSQQRFYRFATP